jgi:hypothetical protein
MILSLLSWWTYATILNPYSNHPWMHNINMCNRRLSSNLCKRRLFQTITLKHEVARATALFRRLLLTSTYSVAQHHRPDAADS